MGSLEDVVHGYTTLAEDLVERWSEHASTVATKLDAGTYDADSAVADLAACATLATESGLLLASEALDALAVATGRQYAPVIVDSDPFWSPLKGATLTLNGPLVDGFGVRLPVNVINVIPPKLDPEATEFSLRANATGYPGGTYVGKVVASKPGSEDQKVTVWITVP